jgi:glycosyltransferase involved in cell wall biosynthesis
MGNVAREIAERTAVRGEVVTVVTSRTRRADAGIPNSEFRIRHCAPLLRFGNAAWCPSIGRALEELQPDVVHLHWPFIGGIAPVLAWRRRNPKRRLVVQYHMDLLASGWRWPLFWTYPRWALPRMLAAADRVVVSSFDYAQHGALARYVRGLRIVEIPLGVDVERFAPYPHPPAPPLPQGGGETIGFSPSRKEGEREGVGIAVLFVGGIDRAHAFKGVHVLLEAIARTPDARLRIVGDGDLRVTYERRARVLGIADRVMFLGAVSDAELPDVYRSSDVLVLSSTARSEAFGLVLLEAGASGIPVIASDLPGVRSVVVDGETGFLVPPGDVATLANRLGVLAHDRDRARRMGTAGRTRVAAR